MIEARCVNGYDKCAVIGTSFMLCRHCAQAEIVRLRAALGFYAKHEHWMGLHDPSGENRNLLVAHGKHMKDGHGWEEAEASLSDDARRGK